MGATLEDYILLVQLMYVACKVVATEERLTRKSVYYKWKTDVRKAGAVNNCSKLSPGLLKTSVACTVTRYKAPGCRLKEIDRSVVLALMLLALESSPTK